MNRFSRERLIQVGDKRKINVIILDDGTIRAQIWTSCLNYPYGDMKSKYEFYSKRSEESISGKLLGLGRGEVSEPICGSLEDVLAYAKELDAPVVVYRGENHWETILVDGSSVFYPEEKK